jgi:hypothetical protein
VSAGTVPPWIARVTIALAITGGAVAGVFVRLPRGFTKKEVWGVDVLGHVLLGAVVFTGVITAVVFLVDGLVFGRMPKAKLGVTPWTLEAGGTPASSAEAMSGFDDRLRRLADEVRALRPFDERASDRLAALVALASEQRQELTENRERLAVLDHRVGRLEGRDGGGS